MSAFDVIDMDIARQVNPQFTPVRHTWKRNYTSYMFTKTVDFGFGYFLRHVVLDYPARRIMLDPGTGGYTSLTVKLPTIEFFVVRVSRQTEGIPVADICTPVNSGEDFDTLSPAFLLGPNFPDNFSATSPRSHKVLNYFFAYGETIQINFTRELDAVDADPLQIGNAPDMFFDFVLKGYAVPYEPSGGF